MHSESDKQPDPRPDAIRRRAFVIGMARKAAYVAPAAIALHAAQKVQAGIGSCADAGSPCVDNFDCCTATPTCEFNGMGCGGMMGCACV